MERQAQQRGVERAPTSPEPAHDASQPELALSAGGAAPALLRPGVPLDHPTARSLQRAALLQAQRLHGNRSVSELIQRQADPEVEWLRPRVHDVRSLAGEKVTYSAMFRAERDTGPQYELVYTAAGGAFDRPGGVQTKTIAGESAGLSARNILFFIDAAWTGAPPATVRLELRRRGSDVPINQWVWTHTKRDDYPTTIRQLEGETLTRPVKEPTFTYELGPAPHGSYANMTLLEEFSFDQMQCSIGPEHLKEPAKYRSPVEAFFGDIPSMIYNSSFVIDEKNQIVDGHRHVIKAIWKFRDALLNEASMQQPIYVEYPQTYIAAPNVPLARYFIRVTIAKEGITVQKRRDPAFAPAGANPPATASQTGSS